MGEAESLVSQAELLRHWSVLSRTVNLHLVFLGITAQWQGQQQLQSPGP
ncbi:hypothetical protein [Candidatus Synechococcus spongiarum]|nr:hypothetical protein [Candidatus Synechococcus spongiarum]